MCMVSGPNGEFCVDEWMSLEVVLKQRRGSVRRRMDSRSVVAMCIDIEATICLVMRVKRDGSRWVDVSDEELVV